MIEDTVLEIVANPGRLTTTPIPASASPSISAISALSTVGTPLEATSAFTGIEGHSDPIGIKKTHLNESLLREKLLNNSTPPKSSIFLSSSEISTPVQSPTAAVADLQAVLLTNSQGEERTDNNQTPRSYVNKGKERIFFQYKHLPDPLPSKRSTDAFDDLDSNFFGDQAQFSLGSSIANQSSVDTAKEPKSSGSTKPASQWLTYHGLKINEQWFKRGYVIVKPSDLHDTSEDLLDGSISTSGSPILSHVQGNADFMKLKQRYQEQKEKLCDKESFSYGTKTFIVKPINDLIKKGVTKNKAEQQISVLFKQVFTLFNKLRNYVELDQTYEIQNAIVNSAHPEEVLLPLVIKKDDGDFGFYIYPWLANNKQIKSLNFTGCKVFVTNICMFGAILVAGDKYGSWPLIKHGKKYHDKQVIETIEYSHSFSAYEEIMFKEVENYMFLINKLSDKDQEIQIYYHLPYYDYILFGVELFIKGRITLGALEKFFQEIILKTVNYVTRIKQISNNFKINSKIKSPFENLFGRLSILLKDEVLPISFKDMAELIRSKQSEDLNLAAEILSILDVPISAHDIALDPAQIKLLEKNFVQHCLMKLLTNNNNERHKKIWRDKFIILLINEHNKLIQECKKHSNPQTTGSKVDNVNFVDQVLDLAKELVNPKDPTQLSNILSTLFTLAESDGILIETLDELFKLANTIGIDLACEGEENYKVCSFLPGSEKHVQVRHAEFSEVINKLKNNPVPVLACNHPNTLYLTTSEMVAYSKASKGPLFYFPYHQGDLIDLSSNKELLYKAHINAALFAKNLSPISLNSCLHPKEKCTLKV